MMLLSVFFLATGFIMLKHAKLADKLHNDLSSYNKDVLSPEGMRLEYDFLGCKGVIEMRCEIHKLRFINLSGIENINVVTFSENMVLADDMHSTIEDLLHYMTMR